MGEKSATGVVIQMQDYSIHDGDGVRTTIFLAGCSLKCQWCANPERLTSRHLHVGAGLTLPNHFFTLKEGLLDGVHGLLR